jgi:hypothetical protein
MGGDLGSWRMRRMALGGIPVYPAMPGEKQVVEMTEYAKP